MLEDLVPLNPIAFFAFQIECFSIGTKKWEKRHRLPDLTSFHNTQPFADIFLGWHKQGIEAEVIVKGSFNSPSFPNLAQGDSIEFFFDTRDVKTTGFTTKFCHHFFFLPDPLFNHDDSIQGGEMTRFRTEDRHELCESRLLKIESESGRKERKIKIFIPSECLHGYDPSQFDRLGFTYRINRVDGSRQNFSASDSDFAIESQPALWSSLKLI